MSIPVDLFKTNEFNLKIQFIDASDISPNYDLLTDLVKYVCVIW